MKKLVQFVMIVTIMTVAVGLFAATITDLKKGGTAGFSSKLKNAVLQKVVVDASTMTSFYAGDTVELFNVPAKTLITRAMFQSNTAAIAAYTIDLGVKGGTLDLLMANAPINGAAGTIKYGDGTTGGTTVFIPYYTGETAKVIQISDIAGATGNITRFNGTFVIEMINMASE